MFRRLKASLSHINHKIFIAHLVLGLCPAIYTTVRVFFLGQLPGDEAYSIAGQLSWVSLFYEVLSEAIILPLFYFIGKVKHDKKAFSNRLRTGMLVSLGAYTLLSAAIFIFAEPLLSFMAADKSIIEASASYIRIESVAHIFALLAEFALVALVSVHKSVYLYIFTAARLVLSVTFDTFLVSELPVSLHLGVNGVGYSNVLVNALLMTVALLLLHKEGVKVFSREKLDFRWMPEFFRICGISGAESLVRNLAYMLMISRMVNIVGEQGTYWVANNFIWGWLLLPVIELGELIKAETAEGEHNVRRNTLGYFFITFIIVLVWGASIPLWRPFMTYALGFSDVEKLFGLVLILAGFYVLYAFQNVCDSTFYGVGKPHYMLFESVVTNSIYYGGAFILYLTGVWTPSLYGIALLFGIGVVFDGVVSFAAYAFYLKRYKINVLRPNGQEKTKKITDHNEGKK